MSDIFHDYMSKRLEEINLDCLKHQPGPVITISRAAGCSSVRIAKMLTIKLNKLNSNDNWSYISKDVLSESAQKMKLNPKEIKTIFKVKDRTVFDEVIQAFLSKDYHLEKKMRKTVINVIHDFAVDGHKVIIGRASHVICSQIKNALHVRIDAPINWRINRVMNEKKYSKDKAIECIINTEKDRLHFRKSVRGKTDEDYTFDLMLNQSTYNIDEITDLIIKALYIKIKTDC